MELRVDEPVVVLTCGRSGSTLLRFVLDSHPGLACPPETNVVDLVTKMGILWKLLEGPASAEQPDLTDMAAASIRHWMTTTFGAYLIKVGKSRWCEKSIGSAESAGRFLSLFPKAKFICLYRNCLDVIDSMLEACPFGLRGYGLDPFVAAHPGNSVAAVADYWAVHTRAIADFEKRYPDVCVRVRYEDLVSDPDSESEKIFAFLDEDSVPGIAGSSLVAGRIPFGPSDHKIWSTPGITTESVGRGARIPVQAIPPGVLEVLSGLFRQLGYPKPGHDPDSPGLTYIPANHTSIGEPAVAVGRQETDAAVDQFEELLARRVYAGEAADTAAPDPGEPAPAFCVTVTLPADGAGGSDVRTWRINPGSHTIERMAAQGEVPAAQGEGTTDFCVTGDMAAWTSVLAGHVNLATAMRQGHIRYTDIPESARPEIRTDTRIPILVKALVPEPGIATTPNGSGVLA